MSHRDFLRLLEILSNDVARYAIRYTASGASESIPLKSEENSKMTTATYIKKLANSTIGELFNEFTYGFELETHASGGEDYHSLMDIVEGSSTLSREKSEQMVLDSPTLIQACRVVTEHIALIKMKEDYISMSQTDWRRKYHHEVLATARRLRNGVFSRKYSSLVDALSDCLSYKLNRNIFEIVEDSSVGGMEIRTMGGLSYDEIKKAIKVVDAAHDIDTRCSFHLHLSAKGMGHEYGRNFQRYLYDFILSEIENVPQCLRDRWGSSAMAEYFMPVLENDKYTFVNYHDQGTWEFRCFGNITNSRDALKCIRLALKAMRYAYRVRAGEVRSISRGIENEVMEKLWGISATNGVSLNKVIQQHKTEARMARIAA